MVKQSHMSSISDSLLKVNSEMHAAITELEFQER